MVQFKVTFIGYDARSKRDVTKKLTTRAASKHAAIDKLRAQHRLDRFIYPRWKFGAGQRSASAILTHVLTTTGDDDE
jgi:hypothetical protein